MNRETLPGRTDPILLLEAGLTLLLFALFIILYFQPAGTGDVVPEWWTAPLLGALFFTILLLERWRRKRRGKSELSRGLADPTEAPPDELP